MWFVINKLGNNYPTPILCIFKHLELIISIKNMISLIFSGLFR